MLRGHVPLEGERIATNARDLGEHLIRVLVGIVVFQKIENLVHIDDGLAHAGDEQFGQQRDGGARVWRGVAQQQRRPWRSSSRAAQHRRLRLRKIKVVESLGVVRKLARTLHKLGRFDARTLRNAAGASSLGRGVLVGSTNHGART